MQTLNYIDNLNYTNYNEFVDSLNEINDKTKELGYTETLNDTEKTTFDVSPYDVLDKINLIEEHIRVVTVIIGTLLYNKVGSVTDWNNYFNNTITWTNEQKSKDKLVNRWVDVINYYQYLLNGKSFVVLEDNTVLRLSSKEKVVESNDSNGKVTMKTVNTILLCENNLF
jgi:hypothetical protein